MKYSRVRFGAVLMVGSLIAACPTANAGWGYLRGGSSGGSSGVYAAGYGSSGLAAAYHSGGSSGYAAYSSVGGSSGGSSGGILHRVAGRIHDHFAAKRAYRAAWRASYGSSGYYASSGGSSGYSSSGGSSGYITSRVYTGGSSGHAYRSAASYGSVGTSSYGSTGGVYYGASKTSAAPAASVVSNVRNDAAHLTVAVPNAAKIFVNDRPTSSTGAVREFVSRGLKPGKSYKFDVRAELEGVDGETMVETKTLVVSAGQREQIQFAFENETTPIETVVTLHVPEGAEVSLAGNPTKATGATRTFRTSRLRPGQVWEDYVVQVRMGEQVKNQSIRLIAGDNLQLTFAFDEAADKLAAR